MSIDFDTLIYNVGMKKKVHTNDFGKRLIEIRKQRNLTQAELGRLIGVSKRVIAYYETESSFPPSHLTTSLAKTLKVSSDELLGLKNFKQEIPSKELSAWKRFKKVHGLSVRDQKTVYSLIHALVTKRESIRYNSSNSK